MEYEVINIKTKVVLKKQGIKHQNLLTTLTEGKEVREEKLKEKLSLCFHITFLNRVFVILTGLYQEK